MALSVASVSEWWAKVIAPVISFTAGLALLAYGALRNSGESLAAATVLLTASGAQAAHKILKGGE